MLSILEAVSTQEKFSSCIALYFQVCLGGSFFPLVVAVAVNSLPVVLSLLTAFYLELCQTTSERILPEESGQVQPLTLRSNRSHSMMELVLVVTVSSLVKSSNDLGKSGQALYIYMELQCPLLCLLPLLIVLPRHSTIPLNAFQLMVH